MQTVTEQDCLDAARKALDFLEKERVLGWTEKDQEFLAYLIQREFLPFLGSETPPTVVIVTRGDR